MRTTNKLYGPSLSSDGVAQDGETINQDDAADASREDQVAQVLTKLGFAGNGLAKSKLGRLGSVLIGDALDSVHREFPNLPIGAAIEVVSTRLGKADLKERMGKMVEHFLDVQQEMLKELGTGKVIEKWEKIAQQNAEKEREKANPEPLNLDAEDFDEEPIEADIESNPEPEEYTEEEADADMEDDGVEGDYSEEVDDDEYEE